jgi:hypothetical protein
MEDGAQQGVPQPLGLDAKQAVLSLRGQSYALQAEPDLVREKLHEALLLRGEDPSRIGRQYRNDAQRLLGAAERPIQGIARRQGIGGATGRCPVVMDPLRDGQIGSVQGAELALGVRIGDLAPLYKSSQKYPILSYDLQEHRAPYVGFLRLCAQLFVITKASTRSITF